MKDPGSDGESSVGHSRLEERVKKLSRQNPNTALDPIDDASEVASERTPIVKISLTPGSKSPARVKSPELTKDESKRATPAPAAPVEAKAKDASRLQSPEPVPDKSGRSTPNLPVKKGQSGKTTPAPSLIDGSGKVSPVKHTIFKPSLKTDQKDAASEKTPSLYSDDFHE
jgi:hypothetical protein